MKNFKKKLAARGGFTLVELIVVIAILAILAGVAVPVYSGYIKKANDAAVYSELSVIVTAVQSVAVEENVGVTKIEVAADGAITVTTDSTVTSYVFPTTKIATYASNVGSTGAITNWSTIIAGSSFEGKIATWTPGSATANAGWKPITPTTP